MSIPISGVSGSGAAVTTGALGDFSPMEEVGALADRGGHIIIITVDHAGESWSQVEAILYSLRAAHLPALKPVLVLSCSRPPRRLVSKCAPVPAPVPAPAQGARPPGPCLDLR